MKFKQFVAGIAPALVAAGFEEVRPHPSYAPHTHVVFVSIEAGDVLCIEFQPMPTPPGRLDFMVRLWAATANWIWAVSADDDVAPLQAALAYELLAVTIPGMRAELRITMRSRTPSSGATMLPPASSSPQRSPGPAA
ncbi:hypothetical protein [Dactylosporangium sp. NPDC048998]|uniref:hypothetical protein n=1 Tax=Dactylosporangium sp. NPDC048998 TaxID=3363976 RepID=UPI0037208879